MSDLLTIELTLNGRLLDPLCVPQSAPLTQETLSQLLTERERELAGQAFSFAWKDERGIKVLVQNETELRKAIQTHKKTNYEIDGSHTLRFLVTENRESLAVSHTAGSAEKCETDLSPLERLRLKKELLRIYAPTFWRLPLKKTK